MMNRRAFFRLAAGAALTPLAAKVAAAFPDAPILYGDGIHDDTAAVQAFIDGQVVQFANPAMAEGAGWFGNPFDGGATLRMPKGLFRIFKPPIFGPKIGKWNNVVMDGEGSVFLRDGTDHDYGFHIRNVHGAVFTGFTSSPLHDDTGFSVDGPWRLE
jgi:hypothetical protein